MHIYFARHAKTSDHDNAMRQSPESELGETGLAQAQKLATRMASCEFDTIISSPWPRALKTAQTVAETRGMPVISDNRLAEQGTNPAVNSLADSDPKVLEYMDHIYKYGRLDGSWKFEDKGESMKELIGRASDFKKFFLETYKDKRVLVVSHGGFLSALLTVFLFDDKLEKDILWKLSFAFRSHTNTGLTRIDWEEFRGEWVLKLFNDVRHLDLLQNR